MPMVRYANHDMTGHEEAVESMSESMLTSKQCLDLIRGMRRSSAGPLLDIDIRKALKERLNRDYGADSLIRDEFGCNGARVDVAVVNGRLHGFEIKSDRDGLERLVTQIPAYNALFDRVTAVVGSKHLRNVRNRIPTWWGIIEAIRSTTGRITLKAIRADRDNTNVDSMALVKLLWRKEICAILRAHNLFAGLRTAPAIQLQTALMNSLPIETLAREVRDAIKCRAESGSGGPQTRNGGSCTIEPNSVDYQSNLNWLLSLQSQHRPH